MSEIIITINVHFPNRIDDASYVAGDAAYTDSDCERGISYAEKMIRAEYPTATIEHDNSQLGRHTAEGLDEEETLYLTEYLIPTWITDGIETGDATE